MNKFHSIFLLVAISFISVAISGLSYATSVNISAEVQSLCGNDTIDSEEQCDGSDLGGQTCTSRGYYGGTLSCNANCTFNVSACTSAPVSSGGGGGGGGYVAPPVVTMVVFSGRAYPKSTVTLLKDAQIAATTIAGADANFQVSVSGLSSGNYIFSVYSEDNKGIRSSLMTFPVGITSGATTNVSGIFIAPTVAVDKSEVKRGDDITIFGQSVSQADIIISVNSEEEFFAKTISDKNGIYLYNFDTSVLDYGSHNTKAKASIGNQLVSGFSYLINFKVGTKNILAQLPTQQVMKGDFNSDKRVNLVDFSIAAYWYKRPSPPVTTDLNGDNKVDIIDFSIMAYYWTG
ncbi:MAG: dockerin type I repeat-containing protein [Spirochaetota bacterium]